MKIHVYQCPGELRRGNICYKIKSVEEEEIPSGWFKSLADAAESAGTKSLAPEKKRKKKVNEARAKKLLGNPYVPPKNPAPTISESASDVEEIEVGEEETKTENKPEEVTHEEDKKPQVDVSPEAEDPKPESSSEGSEEAKKPAPFTAKLTDDDKMEILELKREKMKVEDIAKKFDVSKPTIYKVLKEINEGK